MSMVWSEKTVAIWFMPTTETQDWMCTLTEIVPDQEYEIVYRFRYYDPESKDPFNGKDRKSWTKATAKSTRAYALASIRLVAAGLYAASGMREPYEIVNDGDPIKFRNDLLNAPFTFARMETVKDGHVPECDAAVKP